MKCEQYWPDVVGEPKQYGDIVVEMTSTSNIKFYDYRIFKLTYVSKSVIKQFSVIVVKMTSGDFSPILIYIYTPHIEVYAT